MKVYLEMETAVADVTAEQLRAAVLHTLQQEGAPSEAAISLVLTDDQRLRALNSAYRQVDKPTDVLSFEADVRDPETGDWFLGDVIISVPRAVAQAARAGHPLEAELLLLAIHGALHLLGYDHAAPEEKAQMWDAQRRALQPFGLQNMNINDT